MANNKYYCLSERRSDFKSGYLIIGNTLFQFENGKAMTVTVIG